MAYTATMIMVTISLLAGEAGISPAYAHCIVGRESNYIADAVGDRGRALGLWQWHAPSWRYVRERMGADPDPALRADVEESTLTALYAMSELNLYRWWSTHRRCAPLLDSEEDPCLLDPSCQALMEQDPHSTPH
jgi:hypothetical protein